MKKILFAVSSILSFASITLTLGALGGNYRSSVTYNPTTNSITLNADTTVTNVNGANKQFNPV